MPEVFQTTNSNSVKIVTKVYHICNHPLDFVHCPAQPGKDKNSSAYCTQLSSRFPKPFDT